MKTKLQGLALSLLLVITTISASAQKEASVWYFGFNAGVKFNDDGSVTALTDGALRTIEGCASIADSGGNVLFYTDGLYVWNKAHKMMPNGNGLKGNSSSTQSAIIVPKPGSKYLYYIFTVNGSTGNPNFGAYYSVVNMQLDSGRGDITGQKNISLVDKTDEKITAVKHKNGRDIWIIIPERFTSKIHVFLVTPGGVSASPVISDVNHNINGFVGYMKCSPDGTKLAMALRVDDRLLMASFNSTTGEVSNPYFISAQKPYGLDFSPNSKILYVATESPSGIDSLLQFNLGLSDSNQVQKSRYTVRSLIYQRFYAVQLAVNRKIYLANYNSNTLSVIEYPNEYGSGCGLRLNAVDLKTGLAMCGLPTFIQSMFQPLDFTWKATVHDCKVSLHFEPADTADVASFNWSFGDQYSSPADNVSSKFHPVHTYSGPGTYPVTMVYRLNNKLADTIQHFIIIQPLTNSIKFKDTILYACPDSSRSVQYYQKKARYRWSNGDTTAGTKLTIPGQYKLVLTDSNGCVHKDSLRLLNYKVSKPDLGPDVRLCASDSLLLKDYSGVAFKKYKWSTSETTSKIYGKPAGVFTLKVIDKNGCTSADTIRLNMASVPVFEIGRDTILCDGDSITLSVKADSVSYKWQDGSIAATYYVTKPGVYSLTLTRGTCHYTDQLKITYKPYPVLELGADDSFCGKYSKILDPGVAERYLWSGGDTSRRFNATKFTTYIVAAFNDRCMSTDSITIYPQHNKPVFIPNAFTPNDDHVNDVLKLDKPVNIREFSVYDRWGQLVYSTDNGEAWDGTFMGKVCPDGVYVVCITYTDCLNRAMHERHTVHLLR